MSSPVGYQGVRNNAVATTAITGGDGWHKVNSSQVSRITLVAAFALLALTSCLA